MGNILGFSIYNICFLKGFYLSVSTELEVAGRHGHRGPSAGRCARDHRHSDEGWYQNLGPDGRQAGDGHQHRWTSSDMKSILCDNMGFHWRMNPQPDVHKWGGEYYGVNEIMAARIKGLMWAENARHFSSFSGQKVNVPQQWHYRVWHLKLVSNVCTNKKNNSFFFLQDCHALSADF